VTPASFGWHRETATGFLPRKVDVLAIRLRASLRRQVIDEPLCAQADEEFEVRRGHDFVARARDPAEERLLVPFEPERLVAPDLLLLERAEPRFEPRFG
jgi:hypothetical protein